MTDTIIIALVRFGAIGCGLMAGVYFAFSTFVMPALARIEPASGVAAMNSIDKVIYGSLFMPLFFLTTLASLALAILAVLRWDAPGAMAQLAGGIIYVAGMFGVTMLFNVPLNTALAAAEPAAAADIWARYVRDWTAWNHVRTVASTAACALFLLAS